MKKSLKFQVLAVVFAAFTLAACDSDDDDQEEVVITNSIVDVAVANDDFSILVDAVTKAGLADALANPNASLTVFAPTNAAFSALLTELDASSLDDIPVDVLKSVLLYHVLGEQKTSTQLGDGYYSTLSAGPVEGVSLSLYKSGLRLNDRAEITTPDVMADNGVIHVIDKVLLEPNIVEVALSNPNFSILVEAVVKAELVEALSGDGPLTVFAPTNAAFEALFATLEVEGIDDIEVGLLTSVLLSHVVSGNVVSGDLTTSSVPTLNTEKSIAVVVDGGVTLDGDINVVLADVQTKNGVIHVIDGVILP